MAFHLYRSNRTEWLVDQLDALLERERRGPLEREHIVVEGRGMERWLSQQLARRHGIWAHPGFVFPRQIIQQALDAVLGAPADARSEDPGGLRRVDPYEPEVLLWAVAELLPGLLDAPAFAPVRRYLETEDSDLQRELALAERIARCFDDYVVYRPEMVLGWQDPAGDAALDDAQRWQALLWRALVERLGAGHMAARAQQFFAALQRNAAIAPGFPRRLSLFGLSAMAPLYLRMLAGLGRRLDLHLFVLDPSQQFWADIESPARAARRARLTGLSEEALHLDAGNPLLAALGKQGRDFQRVLDQLDPPPEAAAEDFAEPSGDSLLQLLQRDIRDLLPRHAPRDDASTAHDAAALRIDPEPPLPWREDDDSLAVHCCHSPLREVEVLQDQLLELFARDPGLAPADVVVMAPDIDAYVPYIDAVFGAADEAVRIRHSVADRGVRASHDLLDAFLKLIGTLGGRLSAPELLDLLSCAPIRAAQAISADDLGELKRWLHETGIRWGEDAAHRVELGHPELEQNTWRFGLDRLLLGYAMPGDGHTLFGGVLPHDEVEGSAAELVGKLAAFCDRLFGRRRSFAASRALADWRALLVELLGELFEEDDDNRHEHALIREALDRLVERGQLAGYSGTVDLPALRAQLEALLERQRSSQGFLTGGVTFCSTVPMRAIPFRVVCLLGLDDESFPRRLRSPGFDLMQARERPGDRDPRDDDRYVFLEALLSARDKLILSYPGRSLRDNTALPASVVVRELLDVVGDAVTLPGPGGESLAPGSPAMRQAVLARLVVEHPLQAFSPRYFDAAADPRLFSYSAQHRGTAASIHAERQPRPLFLAAPLPCPEATAGGAAADAVGIEDLVRFFRAPTRALLQQGLGLSLEEGEDELDDTEPLELGGLQHWQVFATALRQRRAGAEPAQIEAAARASGALPLQTMGTAVLETGLPAVEALAELAAEHCAGEPLEDLDLAVELADGLVTGLLRGVWPVGLVQLQYSKSRGHHELSLWIRHLLLNAAAPAGVARTSLLIARSSEDGEPGLLRFSPVEDAREQLNTLLKLYRAGLRLPLPFFEKASWAWARSIITKPTFPERAVEEAAKAYAGNPFTGAPGDRDDPYVHQVYADLDPVLAPYPLWLEAGQAAPGFVELAQAIYGPLLAHREGAL